MFVLLLVYFSVEIYIPSQRTTIPELACHSDIYTCQTCVICDNNGRLRRSSGGFDSWWVRCTWRLNPAPLSFVNGLHCAPAGVSLELRDVDVMEGKAFNANALLGCLAALGITAVAGPGPRVLANQTDDDDSSSVLWSLVVIWSVGPREEGVKEGPKREKGRHHYGSRACHHFAQGTALT